MSDQIRGGVQPPTGTLAHESGKNFGITPFFRHHAPLNVAKSEDAGYAVYDEITEVVELQLAGDRNYSPVEPAHGMAYKRGNTVITWAEMYSEQYQAFIMGDEQVAGGSALELLTPYGITPAQLSICRAMKIYSVEALHSLEDPRKLSGLGFSKNKLKEIAAKFMDDRENKADRSEVDGLRAELAAMKALIEAQKQPEQIADILATSDEDAMKSAVKDEIQSLTGIRPRGNPSLASLQEQLAELKQKG